MEVLKPHEIAAHAGVEVDPKVHRLGTQDSRPDTHPHLIISELVRHGPDGEEPLIVPFRVQDASSGKVHSKIPNEGHTYAPDKVDAIHADALALNQRKNREVVPLVMAAVPELDPESKAHVRVGNEVFDLVDGRMVNRRTLPEFPRVYVSDNELVLDVSNMAEHRQQAIHSALSAKFKVIAQRAGG